MYYTGKIELDHGALVDTSYALRSAGYSVGTTNGCFDLLHPGHVEFLNIAWSYCDALIVMINSDDYIVRRKGRDPIYSQIDRARMVASLGCVFTVTIFDDDDPCRLIKLLYPNYHFNSSEYGDCIEAGVVEAVGGELILVQDLSQYHTSSLIRKLEVD